MSRGLDRDDEQPGGVPGDRGGAGSSVSGSSATRDQGARQKGDRSREAGVERQLPSWTLPSRERRERVLHDRHWYSLRGTDSQVLDALATFRVVLERDLAEEVYAGHRIRAAKDITALEHQGLVARRELASDRAGHHVHVVTLTREGRDLVDHHRGVSRFSSEPDRPVQAGWGKASEIVHDASLYRMYRLEEERILKAGGSIRCVVLDDELKQRLYRELNAPRQVTADDRQARLVELARDEDIPVVDGHVLFPDVRIEYETAAGERSKVDLELATDHYHAGHLAAKARAGFTLYSAGGHLGRGISSLGGGRGGSAYDPRFLSGLLSL